MNKHLLALAGLLLTALLLFGALSFWPEGINIAGTTLNTPTFAETLLAPTDSAPNTAAEASQTESESAAPVAKQKAKPLPAPLDTAAKTILFIGDSMLEGLGPRMAAYAKQNGHTLINVIWYSSTTEIWGKSTRLQELIATHHPNYILVCLGANELFVSDIKRKRQRYLDNILSQIGQIPYVWIGPPNWKPDTGINDMLQTSCAQGTFFLSNGQHFDRSKDGAHPTRQSAYAWADRVCKWITESSAHPIRLSKPDFEKARCKTIVYQPQR